MASSVKKPDSADEVGSTTAEGIDFSAEGLLPVEDGGKGDDTTDGLELDDQQSEEIRQIFGTTLPQYLMPVEEMIGRLLSGTADDKTGEALLGTISSLRDAASRMGFDSASELMDQLSQKVSALVDEPQDDIPREVREGILGDLLELKDLSESMGGETDPEQVSETIFKALQGMEGVDQDVIGKLSAAGVLTVSQLRMARPDEVAAVTGLEMEQVQAMLRQVSEDAPEQPAAEEEAAEAAEAEDAGENVVDLPLEVDPLRKVALQKLRDQVEAEAALDELKAEVRRLRAHLQEQQTELRSGSEGRARLRESMEQVVRKRPARDRHLEQVRQARDQLARRFAVRKEELHHKDQQVRQLLEQRRRLAQEETQYEQQMRGLLEQVERLRRRVVGGKSRVE